MIDAYILESKAANYPRVILGESILKIAEKHFEKHSNPTSEREAIESALGKDSDGMYYIDYFAPDQVELNKCEYSFYEYILKVSEIIKSGIKSKRPDINIKYSWLKEKYNEFIDDLNENPKAFEPYPFVLEPELFNLPKL